MGTEFGVPAVRRLEARDVLPWMLPSLTEAPEAACNCEDDWDVVVPGATKASTLSFENCIRVPTLMHVITNASNDMLDRCGTLNGAVDGLSAVAKMLSGKHTLDRLKSSCFSTPTGKAFHDDLSTVKSQVYRKRWASVASSVAVVYKLERILKWGWDKDRYLDGKATAQSDDGMVASVDKSITQLSWWEAMRVLNTLSRCVRKGVAWCVACPCHHHLLEEWEDGNAPEHRGMIQIWRNCPLRGRRLPEVAAGDFLEYVKMVLDAASARLVVELDPGLTMDERSVLISEFERARGNI